MSSPTLTDCSNLRIAIVHARWNATLIEPLVAGAIARMKSLGVLPENIITTSVPGSWELPVAVQRIYAGSQVQGSASGIGGSGDLLGSATDLPSLAVSGTGETGSSGDGLLSAGKKSAGAGAGSGGGDGKGVKEGAFDAIIAIGVLIKGETVHFEHIAESVSRGLMRVQLDFGVPVVFGLLTVLNEEQAKKRAGLTSDGHNHGEDWGDAAVEMAVKRKRWGDGAIVTEREAIYNSWLDYLIYTYLLTTTGWGDYFWKASAIGKTPSAFFSTTPFSVTMASINAAGVTSKLGLKTPIPPHILHVDGHLPVLLTGHIRHRRPRHNEHLPPGPLLNLDPRAVGRIQVDAGRRRRNDKLDAEKLGEDGELVGADFVRGVPVRGDAVRADDDGGDVVLRHERCCHVDANVGRLGGGSGDPGRAVPPDRLVVLDVLQQHLLGSLNVRLHDGVRAPKAIVRSRGRCGGLELAGGIGEVDGRRARGNEIIQLVVDFLDGRLIGGGHGGRNVQLDGQREGGYDGDGRGAAHLHVLDCVPPIGDVPDREVDGAVGEQQLVEDFEGAARTVMQEEMVEMVVIMMELVVEVEAIAAATSAGRERCAALSCPSHDVPPSTPPLHQPIMNTMHHPTRSQTGPQVTVHDERPCPMLPVSRPARECEWMMPRHCAFPSTEFSHPVRTLSTVELLLHADASMSRLPDEEAPAISNFTASSSSSPSPSQMQQTMEKLPSSDDVEARRRGDAPEPLLQRYFSNPKFLLPLVAVIFLFAAHFNDFLAKRADVDLTDAYEWFRRRSVTLDGGIDERVARILSSSPLIDTHIDLPILAREVFQNHIYADNFSTPFAAGGLYGHVDIPRLRSGKMGGIFWSVFTACPDPSADPSEQFQDPVYHESIHDTIQQIDVMKRIVRAYPKDLAFATSADDFERVFTASSGKKVASVLGIEGLHQIGNSPAAIRLFYEVGVRYITLTHNCNNLYADGAVVKAPHWGGLNPARGPALIREFNRLGMLVDLSHVSAATMRDVLSITLAPVLFSHSSAYALTHHPRNVPDDVLDLVKRNDGVVQVNFAPDFVTQSGDGNATLADVADHVQYIGNRIGWDHVGFGSDYDGIGSTPVGLEDISKYPDLIAELLRRGVADDDVRKATGRNVMRVWRATEAVAARLQEGGEPELEDDVRGRLFRV
ncbi:hypothetical protein Dda_2028 [Drechslerella dactyloides]|uniref:Dipeptidase n=1 Tax=Drechslerella dactyloides TaxID=74499 RepID=A0AAD6J4L3_DREDA|nr:hypothetical protein Dda_2028 [Drechslerella dactyloides]